MKHFAIGWACNLNDIFVRFPYEKCKSLIKKYTQKGKQRQVVKQVFRERWFNRYWKMSLKIISLSKYKEQVLREDEKFIHGSPLQVQNLKGQKKW